MIDITDLDIACFASWGRTGCRVLGFKDNCNPRCPFYKPVDCQDWVRVVKADRVMLYEPEEIEIMRGATR